MRPEALCDTSISVFRHLPSGDASARSASKSMTPATKRRRRRCEMPWAREILNPRGPRAPPCLPTRRSPTRGAAAANANDRPAVGYRSPPERDVVRLVSEGLGNKDIAGRLFVSPRTVQSHLTHVYTKLGLSSRVHLVQLAGKSGPGSGAPRQCRIGARSGRRLCIHCVVGAFRLCAPRRLDARLGTRVSLIRRPESHRSFSFSRRTRWEA
jgi:DNA-binding CsgD family transcriptional regulator